MQTNNRIKKYKVELTFNGETVIKKTDDLNEMFLSIKPDMLHTEMFIKVIKGTDVMDRHLKLSNARKLFVDDMFREIFINNLLLS